MNKKSLFGLLFALLLCTQAKADGGQTIVINGTTVEKIVTKITFSGDQIVLHFSDNSTQATDMASVSITLSASEPTGIGSVEMFQFNGNVGNTLNVSNLAEGTTIQIFNTAGTLMKKAKANGGKTAIDVSTLKKGVYVMRAGNQVVKFLKR